MTHTQSTERVRPRSLTAALSDRIAGPGGVYNLGNLIGLASGIGFALLGARSSGGAENAAGAVFTHLLGNPGAVALSFAMIFFFASGEMYHRAFGSGDAGANARLLSGADFLSGVGGLLLAVSLVYFGEYLLALTSTLLLCGGKFGNALCHPDAGRVRFEYSSYEGTTRQRAFDVFRMAVVLSRLPAMTGLILAFSANWTEPSFVGDGPTVILFGCYVLWLKADLKLTRA